MNDILKTDFDEIVESNLPFEHLQNKTVLITGATGLIGSLLVKSLLYCSKKKRLNLSVIALVRNKEKAVDILGDSVDELQLVSCDLMREIPPIAGPVDFIFHTAAITNSKLMVSEPIRTIETSLLGTRSMLELAKNKNASLVYVSSMEMYGNPNLDHMITEQDYGYIDLSNVRSCYPESKRMCECLCTAYSSQYGVKVCSARLAQTFGAGVLPTENRVFAQFAASVIRGENIILHTKGESEGNYVYTSDAIRGLIILAVKGVSGEAYNVCNEKNHLTIAQMAHMVIEKFGNEHSSVIFDIPESAMVYGYAPTTKMHLNSEKLKALGWEPKVSLEEAYKRLIQYMKSVK